LRAISGRMRVTWRAFPAGSRSIAGASIAGLRVGYIPAWMKSAPATEVDRAALETVKKLGMTPVEVSLPDWPYDSLNIILFAEAAAAFEELTLSHKVDELKMQVADACPTRSASRVPVRRWILCRQTGCGGRSHSRWRESSPTWTCCWCLPCATSFLVITNFTGHPSLTLRAGFVEVSEARSDWAPDPKNPLPKFAPPRRVPYGVTLVGRLFEEGKMAEAGIAMERAFGVSGDRPPGF